MRPVPLRPTRLAVATALGLAAGVLVAPPQAHAAPTIHDVAPLRTITGLNSPQGVAVSPAGRPT